MNERTRKIIVFSTLPIALVWGYFNLFGNQKSATSIPTNEPSLATVAPLTVTAPPAADTDSIILARIRSKSWGIDPFRGRTVTRPERSSSHSAPVVAKTGLTFVLNGIIYSETAPIAYINGKLVKTGDMVNSAKVVSIEPRAVTLDIDGRRLTISLNKEARS